MNTRYPHCISFLLAFFVFSLASCTQLTNTVLFSRDTITIMTYNTQTFFDLHDSGREFSEFTGKSSAWTKEKYDVRLNRLRDVLYLAGKSSGMGDSCAPDIVVLQEVESEMVLKDLCNRLSQMSPYKYAVVPALSEGSSFSTVMLSRYPIQKVLTHTVYSPETSLRPLLEVILETPFGLCGIFAVHWKSKADSSETASIRTAQERMVYSRIQEFEKEYPGAFWLVSGDCNQTIEEFSYLHAYTNPWDSYVPKVHDGFDTIEGSYKYKGQWEKIDHFWYNEDRIQNNKMNVLHFSVVAKENLLTNMGEPLRYNVFSGNGYSDHLPLVLVVKKNK